MSDQNPSAPQPQKLVIEVANQQQATPDFQRMSQEQFNARLTEAEEAGVKRTLKTLGVSREERAQVLAQIAAGQLHLAPKAAAGDIDYKAEYEKLKPTAAEAEQLKTKLAAHADYFKKIADEAFAQLPEPIQKDIARRKIDDPEARLQEIQAMKDSGLLAAIVTQAAPAAPAAAKPATTMAPSGPATTATPAKTAWEQYDAITKSGNRILAAQFRQQHAKAIEASQPK